MTTTPTATFVWFDYIGKDEKKAQAFYGELLGWSTKKVPVGGGNDYTMIQVGDHTIGGYMGLPPGAPPQSRWLAHLQVSDCAAAAVKVKQLGGKVRMEPGKVGDFGTMAVVADPTDATFALWQPVKAQGNGDYLGKLGTWCWNELVTQDPDKAVAFYKGLAGFEVAKEDMGAMGMYSMLKSGGTARAGVMKHPMANAPSAWVPYIAVEHCDQTVEKAKKLGGNVINPGTDVPDVGRIAVVADSNGAVFGLLQAKR
jgi:uncharacterized protein